MHARQSAARSPACSAAPAPSPSWEPREPVMEHGHCPWLSCGLCHLGLAHFRASVKDCTAQSRLFRSQVCQAQRSL